MARYLHAEAANVIAHLVAGQVADNVEAAKIETLTAQLVEKSLANSEREGIKRPDGIGKFRLITDHSKPNDAGVYIADFRVFATLGPETDLSAIEEYFKAILSEAGESAQ